ncbi:MAG: leucine-rich repeat protein [Acetobacterium sp.]|nr:leucine-rich repeat protein [Bacillota bacterium]MCG2729693.1 leucine-rich repeat protein [Acetobacterium sp.]
MKSKLICWCAFMTLFLLCLPATVLAANNPVGVAYRGHIQDLGDYPTDGSWVDSPEIIGTEGQSKRIEGFEIKLAGTIPDGMELRYNVHVQNKGWLYNETDSTTWPKDGAYAGTRGESLRIEAIEIVLTDATGQPYPGYSALYRGHVQNIGNLPEDENQWIKDGEQLGTVGSSLRLEALLVKVVKNQTDLTAYQALLTAIGKTVETDYIASSWETLQKSLADNAVTADNSQIEVNKATAAIQQAYDGLAKKAAPVVYDKAGTYGPATGTQVINGDVIVKADGITLRNLHINGDLYIGTEQVAEKAEEISADTINEDQITTEETVGSMTTGLEDIYIAYFTRMSEGTGVSITGSPSQPFTFCSSGGTQFTATVPSGGLEASSPMQISASAGLGSGSSAGFGVGGAIGSLTLLTSGTQVSLAPGSQVQQLTVQTGASNCGVVSSSTALIQNLVVQGPGATFAGSGTIQNVIIQGHGATFSGSGTIQHADIQADGASFATRPGDFTVAPGVATPRFIAPSPAPSAPPPGTQSQPVISPTGAVAFPTTVTISSPGADCICFTTDGSDPSMAVGAQGTLFIFDETASILIDHALTVKAMAIQAGYNNSAITTATFTQAASADLTGIALSPAVGNFTFSANTYNYPNVTVDNDVEGIFVTALGNGSSVITVNDTVVASGAQIAQPIAVSYNSETAITIVNREPGKLPKTYTLSITVPVSTDSFARTAASDNTATFSWPAQTGATSVKVQQKPTAGTSWSDSTATASLDGNSTTATITGLTSLTAYDFRLLVTGGTTPGVSNTVSVTTPQSVTGVSVNPTTATVNIGATTQLAATVAPTDATDKEVSWSSGNEAVATVDNTGKVTAKTIGTATITVTTTDVSKTADCAVTVTYNPVTKLELDAVKVPFNGETPVTAITDDQYTGTVSWKDGDSTPVATDEKFDGTKAYTATITLDAKPSYGFTGSPAFTVTGADTVTQTIDSDKKSTTITAVYNAKDQFRITNGVLTAYSGPGGVVTIPASVTAIGTSAFENCKNLTAVTFTTPSTLQTIDDRAFEGCENLSTIEIPKNVETIGASAFYYCPKLATVTFAADSLLKTIGDSAFKGCFILSTIAIPKNVTIIDKNAFDSCGTLTSVEFAAGSQLTTIANAAFFSCHLTTITNIPAGVTISAALQTMGTNNSAGFITAYNKIGGTYTYDSNTHTWTKQP